MASIFKNNYQSKPAGRTSQPISWHTLSEEDLFLTLNSRPEGLRGDEASARQAAYGKNILPGHRAPGVFTIILHQFLSPLIYILLAAGVVSVALKEFKDAAFIFGIVLLNAAIGAFQEWKAETGTAALQQMLKVYTVVKRDGANKKLAAEELVPGDIVLLESGNKVPADMRILSANSLSVDESFLTGESTAIEKMPGVLSDPDTPVSDRSNTVFAGSTVISGRCTGIVVATGHHTEMGKIAKEVAAAEAAKPPLILRLERFSRQVCLFVLSACGLLIVTGLLKGMTLGHVFFLAVALAVSAIPEGLPVAVTVALSIATARMAKRHVIVRRLAAVEGLGSCTFIGSDKTGTLTVNQQTVRKIYLPYGLWLDVTGEGYSGEGEVTGGEGMPASAVNSETLYEVVLAAAACNEATLKFQESTGKWEYQGDPVDIALLAFCYKARLNPDEVRSQVDVVAEIPFESERKYAATFYRHGGSLRVALKGAPEVVLELCQRALTGKTTQPLDRMLVEQEAHCLAESGYRVIALAAGELGEENQPAPKYSEEDIPALTFLALFALIDPLRPEAQAAVQKCHEAGVEVAMITGDHPATALAIARELGIAASPKDLITGTQLVALEPADSPAFAAAVKRARVFARVTPLQKLYIVDALIREGHYVAVTGDGVNDAPALRRANIGVAMGSGTDVAKDTAEIIITDDNFASIEAGIEEGRFAYDNIRKVTYLLISTGLAEVILFVLALVCGLPLPLLATQLLWLNLVTNGIQDVALAFEGGEPGTMQKPPRKPEEGIFNPLMIQQTVVSAVTMAVLAFGTWYYLIVSGWEEDAARNTVLLLMVLLENFHVFNCRSEYVSAFRVPVRRNPVLIIGVLVAQGVHIAALYLPFTQKVLGTAPVTFGQWLTVFALASILLAVMEIFKAVRRARADKKTASNTKRSL